MGEWIEVLFRITDAFPRGTEGLAIIALGAIGVFAIFVMVFAHGSGLSQAGQTDDKAD